MLSLAPGLGPPKVRAVPSSARSYEQNELVHQLVVQVASPEVTWRAPLGSTAIVALLVPPCAPGGSKLSVVYEPLGPELAGAKVRVRSCWPVARDQTRPTREPSGASMTMAISRLLPPT